MEERKRINRKIPEVHKRSWIVGGFGAAIGAGIGAYVSHIEGSNIYAGIGAGIGFILGSLIGILIGQKISLQSLVAAERIRNTILGLLSFSLAIAGVAGFVLTKKWVGILGAIFFGLCGIYLFRKRD